MAHFILTLVVLLIGCDIASSYNDSALVLCGRLDFDLSEALRVARLDFSSAAVVLVDSMAVLLDVLETPSSSLSETGSCLICLRRNHVHYVMVERLD